LTPVREPATVLPFGYQGPERRKNARMSMSWHWLSATLDEIDYGVLLLNGHQVLHANYVAREELDGAHPLQIVGHELRSRSPHDAASLAGVLSDAAEKGLRRMLALGQGAQRMCLAVIPLGGQRSAAWKGPTLMLFGRRRVCMNLSAHSFARAHGLTPAESAVLDALCAGEPPAAIACRQEVAISTVRTQISSIRSKTGATSIRHLLQQVATLPPLIGALRHTGGAGMPRPGEATLQPARFRW
jgi:DNA-binding CsgD family transcriptional regulator